MKRARLLLAALALSALQIAFLSWMIAGRAAILRNGTDVLLKVEPVDPRDLLRGDYVTLSYEIRNVPARVFEQMPSEDYPAITGPVTVRLGRDADGFWRPRAAAFGPAIKAPPAPGEVDLRGQSSGGWTGGAEGAVSVDYGIDRFYVPEGEGRAIEGDLRERPFGVLVAVDRDGMPQIKALMDGSTALFEEPLY